MWLLGSRSSNVDDERQRAAGGVRDHHIHSDDLNAFIVAAAR